MSESYETKDFKALLMYVDYLAKHKMGYPVSLLTYFGIVSNKVLGIRSGSLANVLLNNVGDPFKDSDTALLEVKKHEREIIAILEKYFGTKQHELRGYVTSGGTEGNFAGLWWSKRYLINLLIDKLTEYDNIIKFNVKKEQDIYSDLSRIDIRDYKSRVDKLNDIIKIKDEIALDKGVVQQILTPTLFYTKVHTHYSVAKIAEILKLNIRTIAGNEDGTMDLANLQKEVLLNLGAYPHSPIIVLANMGTTITGGIDDVVGIKKIMEKLASKVIYTIHVDGALTGFVLPVLKPFGENIHDYFVDLGINSLAFSAHKYLGMSQPCGIILAQQSFYEKAFDKNERTIEYVGNILDITVTGSRSGLTVLMFYNTLITLQLDHAQEKLQKMVEKNIACANRLFVRLKELYGEQEVTHFFQFNITFPKPSALLCRKYQLMLTGKRATICILPNISEKLINEFLIDLKIDKERTMENVTIVHDLKYAIQDLTQEYAEKTVELFVKDFCENEPITKHLNIHPMDYQEFAEKVVEKAIQDGLSKIAVNHKDEVIAIAIADDLANEFEPNLAHYPKLEPVFDLINDLSKPFLENKTFLKGKILHLWIAAVAAPYQGLGLSTKIDMACIHHGAQKGYDFAYTEFTNEISEKVSKQFNVLRLCNRIKYEDFVDKKGKKPFIGLSGTASSYVATIRPGVSLDDLANIALVKDRI